MDLTDKIEAIIEEYLAGMDNCRSVSIHNMRAKLDMLFDASLASSWQSIETAPKDGTIIDVWTQKDGRIPNVYWDGEDWVSMYLMWSGIPTHWMPLPEPPGDRP